MQFRYSDGNTTWKDTYVELHTDGFLRWREARQEDHERMKGALQKQQGKAERSASDVVASRSASAAREQVAHRGPRSRHRRLATGCSVAKHAWRVACSAA